MYVKFFFSEDRILVSVKIGLYEVLKEQENAVANHSYAYRYDLPVVLCLLIFMHPYFVLEFDLSY
jgi:hypothetical protein